MRWPDVPEDQMLAFESEAFNEGAAALDEKSVFDQYAPEATQDIPYLWPQPFEPPADLPPIPLQADTVAGPTIPPPPVRDDWGRGQDYGGPLTMPADVPGSAFLPMGGFGGDQNNPTGPTAPLSLGPAGGQPADEGSGGFLPDLSGAQAQAEGPAAPASLDASGNDFLGPVGQFLQGSGAMLRAALGPPPASDNGAPGQIQEGQALPIPNSPPPLPGPDEGAYYPPSDVGAAPYRYDIQEPYPVRRIGLAEPPQSGVFNEYSGRYEPASDSGADLGGPPAAEPAPAPEPDLASKLGTAFHALGDLISGKAQDVGQAIAGASTAASDTLNQASDTLSGGLETGAVTAGDFLTNPDNPEAQAVRAGIKGSLAYQAADVVDRTLFEPARRDFDRWQELRGKDLDAQAGDGPALTPQEQDELGHLTVAVAGNMALTAPSSEGLGAAARAATGVASDYERMFGAVKPPGIVSDIGSRIEAARTGLVRAWTDRDVDLAKFQQQAAAVKGAPLSADEMAYELKRLDPSKATEVALQDGLAPALRSLDAEDRKALSVYLTHQDNVDVARVLGNEDRAFSGGLSAAESARRLAEMPAELGPERMAKIEDAAQQVWDFGKQMLQRKLDSGLINRDTFDTLTQQYPHYVPTRITDYLEEPMNIPSGKSLNVNDTGLRHNTIEGTTKAREDPLASMVRNAYQTEALARKNDTFNAFVKLRDLDPSLQDLIKQVPDSYTAPRGFSRLTGFVDGDRVTYAVPEPIAAIISNEPKAMIPGLAGAIWRGAMGLFRAGVTTLSTPFLASNSFLDASAYGIRTSAREGGPQNVLKVLAELGPAYRDSFKGLFSGTYHGNLARFYRGGGGQFGFYGGGRAETMKTVADLSRSNVFEIHSKADIGRLVKDLVTLRPIEAIGERIEAAPRVAAFRMAEKRGENVVNAVIQGRSVTLDFSQGGNVARVVNQFVPFFNVGMQSAATPVRAFLEHPKAFAATMAAMVSAPTIAAEAWNRSDPQRAKDYADVPNSIKDQGQVVMLPGAVPVDAQGNRRPQYVLIRLREFAPLAVVTREAAARALGDSPRAWGDLIGGSLSSLSPIQGNNPADMLSSLTPLGVSTGLQLATNRDYFRNRDIATQRNDEQASALSKGIAGLTGARPSQVEFAARDLGGGVAGQILGASDLLSGNAKVDQRPGSWPLVGGLYGRFVRDIGGGQLEQARSNTLSDAGQKILKDAGVQYRPGPVQSDIRNIPLNRDEETVYQQLANRYTDQAIQELAKLPEWRSMGVGTREQLVQISVNGARTRAAAEVLGKIPQNQLDERLKALVQKKAG